MSVGRNDPCPCGSGRKHKRCCLGAPGAADAPTAPGVWHRWSQHEIRRMPIEAIVAKLGECGIPFRDDEFLEDVGECLGSCDIYERWKGRFRLTTRGFDEDFPRMAAEVLWERLAPDKTSTEQYDDMMQAGYDLLEARDERAACELWLRVWDGLKARFPAGTRTVQDAESSFRGTQCLFNWCQDLEETLGNAGLDDARFRDLCVRYCREFCEIFPESHEIVPDMRRAVAESLFLSDRKDEADREFRALVDDYPGSPWGYIAWGDAYAGLRGGRPDPMRAEELYRKALGIDPGEDEIVEERLRELKGG